MRQLLFYNCVVLIDVFLYSNVYAATPRLSEFLLHEEVQVQCSTFVTRSGRRPLASPRKLFELYANLKPGLPLATFCQRYRTRDANVDDRRFITFGLVHGFVRRIHDYAVNGDHRTAGGLGGGAHYQAGDGGGAGGKMLHPGDQGLKRIMPLLDGVRHVDDVCTTTMRSHAELSQVFKAHPRVSVVFK